jgi:hypothetical protein
LPPRRARSLAAFRVTCHHPRSTSHLDPAFKPAVPSRPVDFTKARPLGRALRILLSTRRAPQHVRSILTAPITGCSPSFGCLGHDIAAAGVTALRFLPLILTVGMNSIRRQEPRSERQGPSYLRSGHHLQTEAHNEASTVRQ